MATRSLTQLGLGSADLTAIGKLSETGLSQVEIADAVVEGNKLKKGNITAGQVGAYTKAEVDALVAGGTGGSIEGVTLAQTTGSGTDVIMSQKAVSDRIQYTNSTPVPTAIGGVKSGTTFNKTPINDVLDMLLYPYQNPSFGSFTIDGQSSGSFELGHTYPSGNKLFTWNIVNPNNVKENSIVLNSESGFPVTIAQPVPS